MCIIILSSQGWIVQALSQFQFDTLLGHTSLNTQHPTLNTLPQTLKVDSPDLVVGYLDLSVNMVIRNVSQYGYQKYWVKWLSKILGRMVIKNIG